jgi:septum formation protein
LLVKIKVMLSELLQRKNIILGSKSPRRKELLEGLGISFETRTKDVDESFPNDIEQNKVAKFLAEKKSSAFVNELTENDIIITSDTIVLCHGEILGKPKDEQEAFAMLSKLSGTSHQVITGVCIKSTKKTVLFSDTTKVWFKTLTSDEINYYIKNHRPFDKAGSYGIQEWIGYIGIEKIEGTYFNVMGLPVNLLYKKLQDFS